MGYLVLLHFDRSVSDVKPAQHYLEYAENIRTRLADHVAGDRIRTSGIMYACYERGIKFVVARIWRDASRRDEYRLRQQCTNPRLCPICRPSLNLYTPYQAGDPDSWYTMRLQPDTVTPRYGDFERLKPYEYKPKHRTRSNGESNRTSGNAASWHQDTKARLTAQEAQPLTLPDDAKQFIEERAANERLIASALGVPADVLFTPLATLHAPYKQNQPPQDSDHTPIGFDADPPF